MSNLARIRVPRTRMRIKKPASDLIKAAKIRTRLIKYMKIIFEDVDFLITPTCGQTPEPIHEGDSVCKFFLIKLNAL